MRQGRARGTGAKVATAAKVKAEQGAGRAGEEEGATELTKLCCAYHCQTAKVSSASWAKLPMLRYLRHQKLLTEGWWKGSESGKRKKRVKIGERG